MDMTGIVPRIGTALLAAVLGCALAVAQGWQHLGKLQRVEKLKDGVELTAVGPELGGGPVAEAVVALQPPPTTGVTHGALFAPAPALGEPRVEVEEDRK